MALPSKSSPPWGRHVSSSLYMPTQTFSMMLLAVDPNKHAAFFQRESGGEKGLL